MAKKKHAKPALPRHPVDAVPASETDAEATRDTAADTDVERAGSKPLSANVGSDVEGSDSGLSPSMGSVEALDPATPRVDIEHDDGAGAADVERGPP
jgi:hypothetical protein